MTELLTMIFLFVALGVLVYIVILLFMHLYQIFEEPAIQAKMRKLWKPVQPWVTVLLYSRDNEGDIEASLKAIQRRHYHNFDIVVVKDFSRDAKSALLKGYNKSQKGEVVVTLRAGAIVSPSFIKRAVVMKGQRRQLTLRFNEPAFTNSFTEVLQTLDGLFWQRASKVQVSDAKNISVCKNTKRFNFAVFFIFAAIAAVDVMVNDPIVLWYGWLLITGYLLAVIWLREEKVKIKLQLSFSAFSALFMLPVASVAMRLSQFRTRN